MAGCQFRRTCNGYVLRGQWSLECEHIPPRLSCQPDCAEPSCESQVELSSIKPERIPLRSRLRSCLMASRFHSDREKEENSANSTQKVESPQPDKALAKPEIKRPDLVLD
jgi:hypothetical protein